MVINMFNNNKLSDGVNEENGIKKWILKKS